MPQDRNVSAVAMTSGSAVVSMAAVAPAGESTSLRDRRRRRIDGHRGAQFHCQRTTFGHRIDRDDVAAPRDPRAHHRRKADRACAEDDDRVVAIESKRVEHRADAGLHTATKRCGQRGIDGFGQHDGVGGTRERVGGEAGLPEEAATQGFSAQPQRTRPIGTGPRAGSGWSTPSQ